jgi:hypothetical protein
VGPLRSVNVPYTGPASTVNWRYDEGSARWLRTMGGAPHRDGLDNQQIGAENLLVYYARLFTASNVEPDSAGNPVLDAEIRGSGKARLFHSGQMFEGSWTKEHDRAKTVYKLDDGSPLPFRPGRVWIHIVPQDFNVAWS